MSAAHRGLPYSCVCGVLPRCCCHCVHTNTPLASPMSAQSAPLLVAGPLCVLDLQSLARVISMHAVHPLADPTGCGLASLLPQRSTLVLSQRAYTAATASIYGSSQHRSPPTPPLSLAQSRGDVAVPSLWFPYLAYYTWPRVPHVCALNFLALFYTTCLLMFNTGCGSYSSSTAYLSTWVTVSLPALSSPHMYASGCVSSTVQPRVMRWCFHTSGHQQASQLRQWCDGANLDIRLADRLFLVC